MKDNKEHNSYIGGLINGVSSLLTGMKEDHRTISGEPEDTETLRTLQRYADDAPQRAERASLRSLRPVSNGLSQRHHQSDE